MSASEVRRRQFQDALLEMRTQVETHCASLPSLEREALELTAWLYLAEWAAAEASALDNLERLERLLKGRATVDKQKNREARS